MQSDRRELDDLLPWESLRLPAALLLTPSGTKRYLDHMAVLQRLGEPGILGLADRVQRWQQGWFESGQRHFNDALTDIFMPNVSAVAASHERDELDRRLMRTALGIRRYQAAEGRWPERLSDLAAVGLQASDWTALQAGPFGYQSDSAGAVLWAYDVHDSGSPSRIRSQLPGASEMAAKPGFWHVTRISPSGARPEER